MRRAFVLVSIAVVAACGAFGSNTDDTSTTAADGGTATGASSDAGRGQVACSTGTRPSCNVGSEVCCLVWEQKYDQCIPAPPSFGLASTCGTEVDASDTRIVACDDSSECGADEVCCADFTTLSRMSSACVPATNCNKPGYYELCNRRGLACKSGKTCSPITGTSYSYSRCE